MVQWYQCWFLAIVLLVFLMNKVLQPFLNVMSCFVSTLYIYKHISWYHLLFLATNSSSWSTWASFVVLDVLHLLGHSFLVGFVCVSFCYLECKSFLQHRLFYCLPMLVYHPFPIPFELLILLSNFFWFLLIMWFFYYLVSSDYYYFCFCTDSSYLEFILK